MSFAKRCVLGRSRWPGGLALAGAPGAARAEGTDRRQERNAAVLDRHGTLLVYGDGGAATFVLLRGRDNGRVIVELRFSGGDFSACPRRKTAAVRALPPQTSIPQLWGKGKGRFQTRGH